MQRCTNELYWLDQQARGRMQYDWSDRNLDFPSRRRQYEVGVGPVGGWTGGRAAGLPGWSMTPPSPSHPPSPLQNFINRNLEAKEERINKLHSEGDQLLAAEHPGRNSIEVPAPQGDASFTVASACGHLK
jgi:periplakin